MAENKRFPGINGLKLVQKVNKKAQKTCPMHMSTQSPRVLNTAIVGHMVILHGARLVMWYVKPNWRIAPKNSENSH